MNDSAFSLTLDYSINKVKQNKFLVWRGNPAFYTNYLGDFSKQSSNILTKVLFNRKD